jgi:enolase
MKRGCKNGMYKVAELVFFTVIVDETPYTVKYKIIEKIESIDGFSYIIDVVQDQDDIEILELLKQKRIGTHFRICGDSLFRTKEAAAKKARNYFQSIADQLNRI